MWSRKGLKVWWATIINPLRIGSSPLLPCNNILLKHQGWLQLLAIQDVHTPFIVMHYENPK